MKLNIPIAVSGEFSRVEVLNGQGAVVKSIDGPKNLITDIGLDRMSEVAGPIYSYCRVGGGNSEPSPTDRQLDSQIGYTTPGNATATEGLNLEEGFMWVSIVWTFPLGAVEGNISELATGWASEGDSIFSRALILDQLGNPTTITVLAEEQLRVTWEHRRYWSEEVESGTVVNEGNRGGSFQWSTLPRNISSWGFGTNSANRVRGGGLADSSNSTNSFAFSGYIEASGLGGIDEDILGGSARTPSVTLATGPRKFIATHRYGPTQGNGGDGTGLNGFHFTVNVSRSPGASSGAGLGMFYKAFIDPPIPKTELDILEIDFTVSWARYEE